MEQNFEAMYEELVQFLYRTPWGLVQTTRNGDIQMLNPVAAKVLMPLAFKGRLDNLFDLLRNARPELQALVAAATEQYGVVCEDLPLTGVHAQGMESGSSERNLRISIFLQSQECLMMVLRESEIPTHAPLGDTTMAELNALQNLTFLGVIKTREGVVTWSNLAAQRMLGYAEKQMQDAPFARLMAQDVGELLKETCQPYLMAGITYSSRISMLHRGGHNVELNLTASVSSSARKEAVWTLLETG